jgi:hypothetical protein
MAMTEPRTVKTQLLTELNDLKNALVARSRFSGIEEPDGEEP